MTPPWLRNPVLFKYGANRTTMPNKDQVKSRGVKILSAAIIDTLIAKEGSFSQYMLPVLIASNIVLSLVFNEDRNYHTISSCHFRSASIGTKQKSSQTSTILILKYRTLRSLEQN